MAKRKRSNKTAPTEATPEAPPAPVAETVADTAETTAADLAPAEPPAAEPSPEAEDAAEAAAEPTTPPEPEPEADAVASPVAEEAADPSTTPSDDAAVAPRLRRRRRGRADEAATEAVVEASEPAVEPAPVEPPEAELTAEAIATDETAATVSAEATDEVTDETPVATEAASSEAWPEPTPPPEAPPEAWAWPDDNGEGAQQPGQDGQPAEGSAETGEAQPAPEGARLVSVIESLLFASDKPLTLSDLRRLLGIREGKKISAALDELTEQRMGSGIEVAALSTGWMLRTNPENAPWVSKLLVGKPLRLSRAMLETLAIVAYRQPVTRPEIDDIRGVDCGPVLKTLLDRGLVRIIGKKEDVGRPLLYGTTPEFLRIFNLRELAELPTLREFYDLSAEDQSRVEAEHGAAAPPPSATSPKPDVALGSVSRGELPPEPEETDPLIEELDEASQLAKKALGTLGARDGDEADKASSEGSEGSSATPSGE